MTGMFETDDFQNDEDQGSLEVHSPASSTYYTETIRTKPKDLVVQSVEVSSKAVSGNFQNGSKTKEYLLKSSIK